MSKELEFLEEKYGHNSWKHYPPSKQQVAQWLQEFTEKQFALSGVVESFYCNNDDGEYHNNPCYEQCRFCKETEALQ